MFSLMPFTICLFIVFSYNYHSEEITCDFMNIHKTVYDLKIFKNKEFILKSSMSTNEGKFVYNDTIQGVWETRKDTLLLISNSNDIDRKDTSFYLSRANQLSIIYGNPGFPEEMKSVGKPLVMNIKKGLR